MLNNHDNVKQTAQHIIDVIDKRSKILNSRPSTNQNNEMLYHLFPHEQCPAIETAVCMSSTRITKYYKIFWLDQTYQKTTSFFETSFIVFNRQEQAQICIS